MDNNTDKPVFDPEKFNLKDVGEMAIDRDNMPLSYLRELYELWGFPIEEAMMPTSVMGAHRVPLHERKAMLVYVYLDQNYSGVTKEHLNDLNGLDLVFNTDFVKKEEDPN